MTNQPSDNATDLDDAIRAHLSPHVVALIASKLAPTYAKGEEGMKAEAATAWFAKRLIDLLGAKEFESLCNEMEI